MKKLALFTLIAFLLSLTLFSLWQRRAHTLFLYQERLIPFEQSMAKGSNVRSLKSFQKRVNRKEKWNKVKKLYDLHILHAKPSTTTRIPKIIHQIWLGSPLPERYKRIQKKWKELHPDWEYILWTDEKVKTLTLQKQKLYDQATNWGEKSDILRYEILYQFGGLYADTDYEPLRSFDTLHTLVDFYAGLETIERHSTAPRLGNALIGAAPRHPILQTAIRTLTGGGLPGDPDSIQERTGPRHLTRSFFKEAVTPHSKNVAFPFTYFYPLPSSKRTQDPTPHLHPEAYGIHYWDVTWLL